MEDTGVGIAGQVGAGTNYLHSIGWFQTTADAALHSALTATSAISQNFICRFSLLIS